MDRNDWQYFTGMYNAHNPFSGCNCSGDHWSCAWLIFRENFRKRRISTIAYLFLHGLGQTANSWDKTLRTLHLTEPVFCPELSDFLQVDATYGRLYERVCAYSKPHADLHVCGLSLGAVLALQYALEHEVKSLVLIAPQYKMPKRLLQIQNMIFRFLPRQLFSQMGLTKEQMIVLTRSMEQLDFTTQVSKLRCPIYILCGEKDTANRKAAEQLAERIPQAQLDLVSGARHEVNVDVPEALADCIQQFYKKL